MISELAILAGALYAAGMVLLAFAVTRSHRRTENGSGRHVSVIIAARNEEKNIRNCLTSIAALRYPPDLLEVIVVDDFSTDATGTIIAEFSAKFPFMRGIRPADPAPGLKGKVNALVTGIEQSKGGILMFTDADCVIGPDWVSRTASYYTGEDVAVVAGFTDIRTSGLFSRIQALDWLMLLSAASAAASLGFPVTAVGNNLSVTRTSYDRTGGYRKIPFNITEDLALFEAVLKLGKMRAVIPPDPLTIVKSEPCVSLPALFAQRKRWFVGGRQMSAGRFIAFGLVWLFTLVGASGFLYLDPVLWGGLLLLKVMADLLLILPSIAAFGRGRLLFAWLPFQVYFTAYILLMPLMVMVDPGVVWKERRFEEKEKPSRSGRASA